VNEQLTAERMTPEEAVAVTSTVRVRGERLTELPRDLYIPPDALEVFLEAFEGPLDLLLYLIRRQNLDVRDIPIASITRQYMEYVELMKDLRLELAAEYLVMAAVLAEIKSRILLPRPVQAEEEDEDPRAELVRRLQEYERYKTAAENMDSLPRMGRDLFGASACSRGMEAGRREPEVSLQELLAALADVMAHGPRRNVLSSSRSAGDAVRAGADEPDTRTTQRRFLHPVPRPASARGGQTRHRGQLPGSAGTDQGGAGGTGSVRAVRSNLCAGPGVMSAQSPAYRA